MPVLTPDQPEPTFDKSPKSGTKSDSTKLNKDSTLIFRSQGANSRKTPGRDRASLSIGKGFSQSTSKQLVGTDLESQSPTNTRVVSYVNSKYKAKGFSKTVALGLYNSKNERPRLAKSLNLTLNSPLLHRSWDSAAKPTSKN